MPRYRGTASASLLRHQIRHCAARLYARAARRAWLLGQAHQTAPDEIRQRVIATDGGQPRDPPAATRDNDLNTLLDAIEVLAQAIVQRTNANLLFTTM